MSDLADHFAKVRADDDRRAKEQRDREHADVQRRIGEATTGTGNRGWY